MTDTTDQPYTAAFYDSHADGALRSARLALRVAFGLLDGPPAGIVDIGCGIGAWLRAAQELGAGEALGIDGDWVPREQLLIPADRFLVVDLAAPDLAERDLATPEHAGPDRVTPQSTPRDFATRVRAAVADRLPSPLPQATGLAMSLEVAEHLPAAAAPGLVGLLAGLADAVLFSAAIPYQGGESHVNEQWPDYWAALFAAEGFRCFDLLRPALWSTPGIEWWYAQNLLLFARAGSAAEAALLRHGPPVAAPARLVHPQPWLGLAGQPAAPRDPYPLVLPISSDQTPAPEGPIPLPAGGTLRLTNANAWTYGKATGMQLHPNSPWEPGLRLEYRDLPPSRRGQRLFSAVVMTGPEAPPVLLRIALVTAAGQVLDTPLVTLLPGERRKIRRAFWPNPEACGLILEVAVPPERPDNYHAAVFIEEPWLE